MVSGDPNAWKHGFGQRPREVDDEYRSRIKGVPRKRKWTKEKCLEELDDILQHLKKVLREDDKVEIGNPSKLKRETVRDLNTMMNRILDFMKYLYPPVQKQVSLNIDMSLENHVDRVKKRMEEKYGIVIEKIGGKKEKEEEIEVEDESN